MSEIYMPKNQTYEGIHLSLHAPEILSDGSEMFSGFAHGKFQTWFSEIEVKKADLKDYFKNTNALIKARQAKGEPGIPIDAKNHNMGDAAGWVTALAMGEEIDSLGKTIDVIKFQPKWTSLGVEVLSEKLVTNFSATFNMDRKVILGGSLTNWPATKDKNGIPIFSAVKLDQSGAPLERFRDGVANLFEELVTKFTNDNNNNQTDGGNTMPENITLDSLDEDARASLVREAQELALAELGLEGNSDEIMEQLRGSLDTTVLTSLTGTDLMDGIMAQLAVAVDNQVAQLKQDADRMISERIAEMNEKRELAAFCANVTAGTPAVPFGLRMDRAKLLENLDALPSDVRKSVMGILSEVWENGRVDYSELGHSGNRNFGTEVLAPEIAAQLQSHLDEGASIEEFFAAAGEDLNPMENYDLRAFEAK
jgi:hypothetical protein